MVIVFHLCAGISTFRSVKNRNSIHFVQIVCVSSNIIDDTQRDITKCCEKQMLMKAHICACVRACVRTYVRTYVRTNTYVRIYVYLCMYIRMYIGMYVHTYVSYIIILFVTYVIHNAHLNDNANLYNCPYRDK